ncbi:glycosyltransferase [Candidatus Uhrbacteria bacterium]|nr:glycosyltransferase [Candidatus Uhrbacteria bacterium]MBD3284099.1 glycosyltransferase [Candidatus Uhrbacteria bacterium]
MITFIFPAFNEEENLKRFPAEAFPIFDQLGEAYEVVIIDDGSMDHTANVAQQLGDRVRLIQHDRNRGLGAAVRTGITDAKGELVITMDSDLTFTPKDVLKLLERYRKGDVDVVSGSPKLAGYGKEIPSHRILIGKLSTLVYSIVFGRWLSAVTPIFRLYQKKDLDELTLQSTGFDINAEILFELVQRGKRVAEVPTMLTQRIHGESKLDYKKEMKRHLRLVLRMVKRRMRFLLGMH